MMTKNFASWNNLALTEMEKPSEINPLLKTHVMKDEHAPDKFRVRGPLSNSQKFAETWGCPLDRSTMNPSQKCEIWG